MGPQHGVVVGSGGDVEGDGGVGLGEAGEEGGVEERAGFDVRFVDRGLSPWMVWDR